MDPTALVIAITGLITTASSPLILSWRNARNQRESSLRDLRTELYTESTVYAQNVETTLDWVVTPYAGRLAGKPELPHIDAITARMRLLASAGVMAAWLDLLASQEAFRHNISEDYPGSHVWDNPVPSDDPSVLQLKKSVRNFYAEARDALEHSA